MLVRVYQAGKMMTLPENKKQIKSKSEEGEERINIIDSGNVLGWIPTVLKGTDVETLNKLLYLCIGFNGFNVQL